MDSAQDTIRKPFIDHLSELRTRLFWILLAVGVSSGAAFAFNQQLLAIIQRPLHQTLYFTSPTGGLTFIVQLCVTIGLVVAFPVIAYHLYRFISPVMAPQRRIVIFSYISASFVLACGGVVFAYFVSLPAALHFLTQFGGDGIESLIKADEYFSFALTYIAGFAIMFQIPLLVLLINRIKPLKPGGMMKAQRWVILLSFIAAAVITPTPDPVNQTLMAAPAIVLYQFSIFLVMAINRAKRPKKEKAAVVALQQEEPVVTYTKNLAHSAIKGAQLRRTRVTPVTSHRNISDFIGGSQPLHRQKTVHTPSRPAPQGVRPVHRPQPVRMAPRTFGSIDGIL